MTVFLLLWKAADATAMNEGTNRRTDVFSGLMNKPAAIPVAGVSYERGRSLDIASRADGGATVHHVGYLPRRLLQPVILLCRIPRQSRGL
jgi:hypothetical protein